MMENSGFSRILIYFRNMKVMMWQVGNTGNNSRRHERVTLLDFGLFTPIRRRARLFLSEFRVFDLLFIFLNHRVNG